MNRTQLSNFEGRYRFGPILVAVLVGLASVSGAANSGTGGSVPSYGASAGIQDPMNPEAYMRDLAARMDPHCDRNLLLNGVGASKTGPAPRKPSGPGTRAAQGSPTFPAGTAPQNPAFGGAGMGAQPMNRTAQPFIAPEAAIRPPTGTIQNQAAPAMPTAAAASRMGMEPAADLRTLPTRFEDAAPVRSAAPGSFPQPSASMLGSTSGVVANPVAASPALPLSGQMVLMTPDQPPIAPPAVPDGGGAAGNGSGAAGLMYAGGNGAMPRGPGAVQKALLAGTSGLTLWEEPKPAFQMAEGGAQGGPAGPRVPQPKVPWTLGGDLEKYRAHAVKEGSRNSGENLQKALERAGMTLGDGVNVFVLGYASDRAKPFRGNDGKGLLDEPGKVPARAGATAGSLGYGLYSIVDLVALNALPDPKAAVYADNNPLVRPLIFTGRTIGGVWKTTEEMGNALTWGLFDNVTGCIGLVIEDIVELIKHAGQAVTNVARTPFHLVAGKKKNEGLDRTLDWILLVPLELASNAVEMKGFSNMEDYEKAFAEKGVIGSVLEFAGSTYIVYRAVDEVLDKRKKDRSNRNQNEAQQPGEPATPQTPQTPTTPETPVTPEPPVVEPVPIPSEAFLSISPDGTILYSTYWDLYPEL